MKILKKRTIIAGNEFLYRLTNKSNYDLILRLETTSGQIRLIQYTAFRLLSEAEGYRLMLGQMIEGAGTYFIRVSKSYI